MTISSYNHAEQISKGVLTYSVKESILTITQKRMLSKEEIILFKKEVDNNVIQKIENIKVDNLKDNYFNKCILTTSGNEYFVSVKSNDYEKNIHLHHYYNEQVEKLIIELNSQVPKKLKIDYLKNDTNQDCT